LVTRIVFFFLIIFPGTCGEMCVSRAMKTVGEVTDFRPRAIATVILRAMKVPWFWIGLTLMATAFFSLLGMLSLANVSFVFPATALSYAVGTLGGKVFLGEQVTPQRWVGVALVCVGVALVVIGKS
jgi:drug/metabolite transporter (DMT)-like permease